MKPTQAQIDGERDEPDEWLAHEYMRLRSLNGKLVSALEEIDALQNSNNPEQALRIARAALAKVKERE